MSGSECILAWLSWCIHAPISSTRGHLAPPMNTESDIMREKMHGKQTGTGHGTRPLAYYDVTGIYWPIVVRHLGIAPISRFGPRQLGIPSCTQSRDWHATGIATWRPLREYWRSVSAQLGHDSSLPSKRIWWHIMTQGYLQMYKIMWNCVVGEKNCSCCACSISLQQLTCDEMRTGTSWIVAQNW